MIFNSSDVSFLACFRCEFTSISGVHITLSSSCCVFMLCLLLICCCRSVILQALMSFCCSLSSVALTCTATYAALYHVTIALFTNRQRNVVVRANSCIRTHTQTYVNIYRSFFNEKKIQVNEMEKTCRVLLTTLCIFCLKNA